MINESKIGDRIKSLIHSRVWIDVGEVFIVDGIVRSELDENRIGVSFIDRYGGIRVFWNVTDYEIL